MQSLDIAVVGSGIGGSLISALNKDKNLILFEKDKNLGGCASTFKRFGRNFNTGATTFVGYEDGHILKNQFDQIGLVPDIEKNEVAIRVVQNGNTIDRIKDFDKFLDNIQNIYPNKNNRVFWSTIRDIDKKFWELKRINYLKYGFKNYLNTAFFIGELLSVFKFDLLKSANWFIKSTLGDISKEYKNFIDAQLLITIQTNSKDISLLSMALGLSYPFHDVFYVNNGMGKLIEDIVKDIEVHSKEEICSIKKVKDKWILSSKTDSYESNNVILNSTIYQSAQLFEDKKIKDYFNSFSFSDQSAFVVYLYLENINYDFLEHYQFIYNELIPNCISNSFFVSFSSKNDEKLSKQGISVTISTHSKAKFWKNLAKDQYEEQKAATSKYIMNKFLNYFDFIKIENITREFSATSSTFNNYINRYNCGGKAIGFKNMTELPSCNTPFKGLYSVGDTVFAGQGWPGIAIGVEVLNKELNGVC